MTNWPFLTGLEKYFNNMLVGLSWAHWIGNQIKMKIVELRKHKFLTGVFRIFVLYFIYGSVWAVPTYSLLTL